MRCDFATSTKIRSGLPSARAQPRGGVSLRASKTLKHRLWRTSWHELARRTPPTSNCSPNITRSISSCKPYDHSNTQSVPGVPVARVRHCASMARETTIRMHEIGALLSDETCYPLPHAGRRARRWRLFYSLGSRGSKRVHRVGAMSVRAAWDADVTPVPQAGVSQQYASRVRALFAAHTTSSDWVDAAEEEPRHTQGRPRAQKIGQEQ